MQVLSRSLGGRPRLVMAALLMLPVASCSRPPAEPRPLPAAVKAFQEGLEHYDNGELDAAISAFAKAIELDPNYPEALP